MSVCVCVLARAHACIHMEVCPCTYVHVGTSRWVVENRCKNFHTIQFYNLVCAVCQITWNTLWLLVFTITLKTKCNSYAHFMELEFNGRFPRVMQRICDEAKCWAHSHLSSKPCVLNHHALLAFNFSLPVLHRKMVNTWLGLNKYFAFTES